MQQSRDALGVLVWMARLGCTWGRDTRAAVLSMSATTDGHLCPLELPHPHCLSHWCCPHSPQSQVAKLSLLAVGWERFELSSFSSDFLLPKNLLFLMEKGCGGRHRG